MASERPVYKSTLPFDLKIYKDDEILLIIKPSFPPILLDEKVTFIGWAKISSEDPDYIPRRNISYEQTSNLPPFEKNVFIITNRVVAAAHKNRTDLVFPHGDIRNSEGHVIGCTGLAGFGSNLD